MDLLIGALTGSACVHGHRNNPHAFSDVDLEVLYVGLLWLLKRIDMDAPHQIQRKQMHRTVTHILKAFYLFKSLLHSTYN